MSINIIKTTDKHGSVTLTKKIEGNDGNGPYKFEVTITDPDEFDYYLNILDNIDEGDNSEGRLA